MFAQKSSENSTQAQLDRMEKLLNVIEKRLQILELNSSGSQSQSAPTPQKPDVDQIPKRVSPPSPTQVSSNAQDNRHPELPDDRNPKQDCRVCRGVGLVKCKSCQGRGGKIDCTWCNGNGSDKNDRNRLLRKPCKHCNGTGKDECLCNHLVAGKELCECTMTPEEKQQMADVESAAFGMLTSSFNSGAEIMSGFPKMF